MSKLAVVAFPQAAAKIVYAADDFQTIDTDTSQMCFGDTLVDTIKEMIKDKDDINEIVFLGPQDYVMKFAEQLDNNEENIPVSRGEM